MNIRILSVIVLLVSASSIFSVKAQKANDLAMARAEKAAGLEKQGNVSAAIVLLEEAHKMEPSNNHYAYNLARLYNKKRKLSKSVELLNAQLTQEQASDSVYLLLGQTYKRLGKTALSLETFEKGLSKFPKAGAIYEEVGNFYNKKKQQDKALTYYEKGIEMDPMYPGNYYHAAKIFFKSPEEVWGMMFGELFMNLERTGSRNLEISKLILDTYKSEIDMTGHHRHAHMTEEEVIKSDDRYADLMHPFGVAVYHPILLMSLTEEDKINIYAMDRARRKFVVFFFNGRISKKYPNALFEYHRVVNEAGHMEAYNIWVMRHGDPEGFKIWKAAYKAKWAEFEKWFPENPIKLDDNNKLYRNLYDPAKYIPPAK